MKKECDKCKQLEDTCDYQRDELEKLSQENIALLVKDLKSSDAQELLMMFIVDSYEGLTGKIKKKTIIKMMQFVHDNEGLSQHINNSNYKEAKLFRIK